jgi:hypothetical protein
MSGKGFIIQKPNIQLGSIELEYDKYTTDQLMDSQKNILGRYIPIVKFGDNPILHARILSFEMVFELFDIPRVYLTIDDQDFVIREYLKNDLTTGIVRVGYQNWALKFNVLFDDIYSIVSDNEIRLSGRIWHPKMYETLDQKSYKNSNIQDILHDISKISDMGLYVYDNRLLSDTIYQHLIRSNMNYLEYLKHLVGGYTNNLWMMDPHYYVHIGDYNTLIQNDVATYSLDWKTGEGIVPKKMTFFRNFMFGKIPNNQPASTEIDNTVPQDDKILLLSYNVDTNYSEEYINTKKNYILFDENGPIQLSGQTSNFGIGEDSTNRFSGFNSHILPYQKSISKKEMPKDIIKIYTEYLIPELNPFDVIELELYRAPVPNRPTSSQFGDLDVEHSGRKLVIGWKITYNKNIEVGSSSYTQEITCI